MAVGGGRRWRLVAVGGWWRLAVGGPWGLSLRAVLGKKKILGFLRTNLNKMKSSRPPTYRQPEPCTHRLFQWNPITTWTHTQRHTHRPCCSCCGRAASSSGRSAAAAHRPRPGCTSAACFRPRLAYYADAAAMQNGTRIISRGRWGPREASPPTAGPLTRGKKR